MLLELNPFEPLGRLWVKQVSTGLLEGASNVPFCGEQQGEVHDSVVTQKLHIGSQDTVHLGNIVVHHVEKFVLLLNFQVVGVLEGRRVLRLRINLDFSAHRAPFKVEDALNVGGVMEHEGVRHQHEVHRRDLLHSNRVHTVDTTDDRLRILVKMQLVVRKLLQEELQFLSGHRLNDESTVVAEEEEAA